MRGVGEIDITRLRWSERPTMLVPILLGQIANFVPGEAGRRFEHGRQDAAAKEQEVLERCAGSAGRRGEGRRDEADDRSGSHVRGISRISEYGMVSRYFVYKQALLGEAERLVPAGVLPRRRTSSSSGSRNPRRRSTKRVDDGLVRTARRFSSRIDCLPRRAC